MIDPAHTFAIDGVGKSYLASSIVLLCYMEVWGKGNQDSRFDEGYTGGFWLSAARMERTRP